ncbi:PD-(D/E)XK nuclease family protein [Sessilibacter sp. MAH1]
MANLFKIQPYLKAIANAEVFITVNARISEAMRQAYADELRQNGQKVAISATIFSLPQWINRTHSQLQMLDDNFSTKIVISKLQRELLWRKIIAKHIDTMPMAKPEHLSSQADSAYRSLKLWEIDDEKLPEFNRNAQQFPFWTWFNEFEKTLEENNWLSAENLQEHIRRAFKDGLIKSSAKIHLIGFDDIAPLTLSMLQSACAELIDHQPTNNTAAIINRLEFNSREDEIIAAALWAKNLLENNLDTKIGIISPKLGQTKTQVERIFTEVFESHAFNITEPRYALPFNFSAGTPLGSTPVIYDALRLLRLNIGKQPAADMLNLLNSPFWQINKFSGLALVTQEKIHKACVTELSANDVRYYFSDDTHAITQLLIDADQLYRRADNKLSAKRWVEFIVEQLSLLGWPGERRLDSMEYQQVDQFQEVLQSCRQWDLLEETFTFSQFLTQLSQLLLTTPFQAQGKDTPIQILGALEAAGLNFDYCWVLSLDDQTWPAAPNPNPLLPMDLQRQYQLPNATAEREHAYAKSLTHRYLTCANSVVISSAQWDGDCELNPSGLIVETTATEFSLPTHNENPEQLAVMQSLDLFADHSENSQEKTLITPFKSAMTQLFDQRSFQWINCEDPQPLDISEPHRASTSLLQWQAIQPFNAFARFRLGLNPINDAETHLSPAVRGQITHDALALIWETLENKETLATYHDDKLIDLISQNVEKAIDQQKNHLGFLSTEFRKLEKQRQSQLIYHWLQLELSRPDFSVIGCEVKVKTVFHHLEFNLRIDRIDTIGEKVLLIDYKSGSLPSTNTWLQPRPSQPQMPLYFLLHQPQASAIAFAAVNAKNLEFKGIATEGIHIQGVQIADGDKTPDIEALNSLWQTELGLLCDEFTAGIYHNHFYENKLTQYQDDYLSFNRYGEKESLLGLWQTSPSWVSKGENP